MITTRTDTMTPLAATNRISGRTVRRTSVLAAVGLALLLAGCSSGMSSAPTTSAPAAAQAAAKGTIAISNFMFIPARLTVAPRATVTVDNRDNVAHTLTGSSGGFNTMDIAPGTSVTFTAPTKAGTYSYICSIHQYMSGTLVVS
jgi:plastocyanin